MGRAPCCQKEGLNRGRWTAEEDELLLKYIQANGEGSWRSLPKNAGLLRCGKSCRLRWINYLRADLKRGNISPEEEEIIIKMHGSVGNRWSLIAGHLPGRTDNEIKNYWNSHLSRRIHTIKRPSNEAPVIVDIGKITGGPRRKGGKTSRSTVKKSSTNVETRKGHEENLSGGGSLTTLKKATDSCISAGVVVPGNETESGVMGPLTPLQLLEEEIFSCSHDSLESTEIVGEGSRDVSVGPFDGMEDGFIFTDLEIESCMLDGPNEEVDNGVVGQTKGASENGVVGMGEASTSIGSSCSDQIGGLQDGWLDWDWNEVLEKVMDDGGEMCSSWQLSENYNGIWEGDCHNTMQSEGENFAAWLL